MAATAIGEIEVNVTPRLDMTDFHDTVETLARINEEVQRQEQIWGEQNHPFIGGDIFGTSDEVIRAYFHAEAEEEKASNDARVQHGCLDWRGILLEEVYEALAEADAERAIVELEQVSAVAISAIKSIKRNGLGGATRG